MESELASSLQCVIVQFSRSVVSDSATAARQASLCITNSGACSNSCPLSWWCHPTISSSVMSFSSRLQSFPASGSFQRSHFFTSNGQSFGVSALALVLPVNIQDWFPLRWTSWISLLYNGLSRAFSNTTVQKHQFFGAQPSLYSNSQIHTWLLESFTNPKGVPGQGCSQAFSHTHSQKAVNTCIPQLRELGGWAIIVPIRWSHTKYQSQ